MTSRGREGDGPVEQPSATPSAPRERSPAPPTSLVPHAAATVGGLSLLGVILVGVLARPVSLAIVGVFVMLGLRISGKLWLQAVVTRRVCELAEVVEDLRLVVPGEAKLAGPSSAETGQGAAIEGVPAEVQRPFWACLTEGERKELLSWGRERVYSDGEVLFRQGELAEHVVVVLGGWARVYFCEGGCERVIAVRGPGDLIGERASLEVGVRSASVVAVGRVEVLVIETGVFSAFVSDHPHVLKQVEREIYRRLTSDLLTGPPVDDPVTVGRPRFEGQHCTVVFLDVEGYTADIRNDQDRLFVRACLVEAVRVAFVRSRLGNLDDCHWEDRGDGFLIVVPPQIPTGVILGDWLAPLVFALQRHNRLSREAVQIKLRVAVNSGPVVSDGTGVCGTAIDQAARMVEADPFKQALAGSDACLGVIVSSAVFHDVVRHDLESLYADEYDAVRAKVKKSKVDAYMRLTGFPSVPRLKAEGLA